MSAPPPYNPQYNCYPPQPQPNYRQPQPGYAYGGQYPGYPQQQPQVVVVERNRPSRDNNCCLWALLALCCGCCIADCCD
uniref:Cysteine-rich transmembrane CYSTM domain-containing protein n=1 Tax=Meloidogyne javanica TaxID=6303 RepID=A0A915LU16_MELJA